MLEEQLKDLEKRQSELEQSQKAAQERLRIAENSTVFQDMKETMDSLQRQIDAASVESRVWERRLKELETLEEKIKELGILLRKDLPVDEEERKQRFPFSRNTGKRWTSRTPFTSRTRSISRTRSGPGKK